MPDEIAASILKPLMDTLFSDVREAVSRRYEYFERRLDYFTEVQDPSLEVLLSEGEIDLTRLKVICGLNAFFQVVLSPLSSPARDDFPAGLGGSLPITYGRMRFDEETARGKRRMMAEFRSVLARAEIPDRAVQANLLEDLLASLHPTEGLDRDLDAL